jgi:phosphoribosylformylglycinamidine cyclo-ligase
MCVNDLIVQGAEPLFFLDYYATGKLQLETAESVIKGIGEGCRQSNCALIGGETAEMPGMYDADDYDLAGFCVGVVERDNIITGDNVATGDVLIGLAASGPHSNGYSLVRKVVEVSGAKLDDDFNGKPLGEVLLTPTRIYVKALLELFKTVEVKALAHITGGGLPENLPRVLPDNATAVIDTSSWQRPAIFDWLQENGNIEDFEMYRTFNCGIGMVLCVAEADVDKTIEVLKTQGEQASVIGRIEAASGDQQVILN